MGQEDVEIPGQPYRCLALLLRTFPFFFLRPNGIASRQIGPHGPRTARSGCYTPRP